MFCIISKNTVVLFFTVALSNAVEEVEEFLVMFEDLVETEEYKQKEVDEEYKYNAYVKKKALEVEFIKRKLF